MEAEAKPKPTLQPLVNKQVLHVTPTDQQLPPFASSIDHPLTQSTQQNDLIKDEYEFEDDDDYLDSFPPGFRFCPRDDELILHYLTKKVMNEPLPQNRIMDVNLYLHNPETLAERFKQYGEKEWYFFTPRDKKYKNGTRPNRAAGDGYWKATGADKSIFHNKKIVGSRKALVFYKGKPPKGDKTNWIMHEYRVVDSPRSHKDMRLDDWVLCRIYKKLEKSNNKMMRTKDRSPSPSPTPPEETFDYSNEATNIDFDDGNNPYSLDYNAEDMGLMPQPSFYDPSFPNQFFSSGSTYQDEVWGAKNLDFPSQLNYFGVPRTDSLIGLENICSDASNKPFNNVNSRTNSQQQ